MRHAHLAIAIIILLLIALAGAGWWYMAIGRFPLRGDLRHDFSVVDTYGSSVSMDHTFRLRNATGETIRIERIIPNCGCTDIDASTMTIEPDEAVEISVTLTVSGRQDKSWNKHIDVLLADRGVMKLWVYADAKRVMTVNAGDEEIELDAGGEAEVAVYAAYFRTDDEPPAPTIESSDSVRAQFLGWQRIDRDFFPDDGATRWTGTLRIERNDDPLPTDAHVVISLSEAEPVRIAVRSSDAGSESGESAEPPVSPTDREGAEDRGR